MNHLHWGFAFGAALGIHLVSAYAYLSWVPQQSQLRGAIDLGEGGVEIGLGRIGSYADLTGRPVAPSVPDQADAAQQETEPQNVEVKSRPPVQPLPEIKPVAVFASEPPVVPVEKQAVVAKRPLVAPSAALPRPPRPEQPTQTEPSANYETASRMSASPDASIQATPSSRSSTAVRATGKQQHSNLGGRVGNPQDYFSLLIAWLNQHKDYPPAVKKKKQQGTSAWLRQARPKPRPLAVRSGRPRRPQPRRQAEAADGGGSIGRPVRRVQLRYSCAGYAPGSCAPSHRDRERIRPHRRLGQWPDCRATRE